MGFKDLIRTANGKYINLIKKHYWLVLAIYLLITGFLVYHASQIEIRTRFLDLLPESKESVRDLEKVVDLYGGEGFLIGVIEWNYIYKDNITWSRKMHKETSLIKDEFAPLAEKSPEELLAWISGGGEAKIQTLLDYYQTVNESSREQLSEFKDDKFLNAVSQVLEKEILSYTSDKWEDLKAEAEKLQSELEGKTDQEKASIKMEPFFKAVDLFSYALQDNLDRFDLIINRILERKGGESTLVNVAEKLVKKLEQKADLIKYVEYKFQTNFIKDHLLYFIEDIDLLDIKNRIQKKIDYERKSQLISKFLVVDKPVKLDFKDIEEKYEKSTKVLKVSSQTDLFDRSEKDYEYYINKDKDRLLLLIKPSRESTDIGFATTLVDTACEAAREFDPQACLKKERLTLIEKFYASISNGFSSLFGLEKKEKKDAFESREITNQGFLSIGYTGRYVKKIEDAKYIAKDLKTISPVALFLILLSVFIYFRRLRAVLVVGLPLVSGLIWSVGIVKLTIGYFNIITGFLIAILSGLGVDFGVHLYSRYIEERTRGKGVFEALEIVFKTTFLSNLTSTTTTAAAFFVLVISQFRGFSQFGYTAGMGMLLLLIGILFAFPSMVVITEKFFPLKIKRKMDHMDTKKGRRLPFYRLILFVSLVFTILSIVGVFKAPFSADFHKLAAQNTMGKQLEKKAEELIKMSLWPIIIYTKDYETMVQINKSINDLKDKGRLTSLDKLDSYANYLPDDQPAKKKIMLEIKELLRDSVLSKVKDADEKKKVKRLKEMVDMPYIEKQDIPLELSRQFFNDKVPGYFIFYYPRPNWNMSRASSVAKMVAEVQQIYKGIDKEKIIIASDAMIFHDILNLINQEGPIIVILALLAIFGLLWLDFRSLKQVLVVLFPLSIALIWIFGWTFIMGWEFNYFNVVMFPVIMGLGIDYGVHLFHRYKEEGRHNIYFIIKTTGMAILIGALTDIMGFGTLILALYKGIATMGEIAVAGIFSALVAGILFLASILEFRKDVQAHGIKKAILGHRHPGPDKEVKKQ